ncbi:Hypothetical protein PHPALM_12984, partial [Phytophthora palmivora]
MWVRFENKQTKREYANYIFAREQLEMTDWLRDIQLKRRELSHYGKVISDEEFAEILLANVTRTHRDVVRQFSRHYAALALPGTQLMPPTSAQVMNALLAEEALDENVADAPRAIGSTSKQKTNSGADSGGNSKKKRRGRYKAKQKTKDENSGKTKKVVCWKCGEQGHIRPNCPNEKSDGNSQNPNQKQSAGMEAKRWQNKQGSEDVPQRNVEYFEYDQLHDGGSDLEEVLGEPNSLSTPQRELRDSVEVQNAEDEDVEEEIECVIASGEPRERYLSSVGGNESESEHGSDSNYRDVFEEDSDEELGAGESFRRSSRIRRPNVRMKDYELELPESLVIQSMHAVMDPVSVQAALDAPDAEQWIEALNK